MDRRVDFLLDLFTPDRGWVSFARAVEADETKKDRN